MKNQIKQRIEILHPKIYFMLVLILGLVIIFEAISLINVLSIKQKIFAGINSTPVIYQPEKKPEKTKEGIIKIVLEENQKIVPQQNLKAKIIFNSYDQLVAGVDLILNFDPKLISIIDASGNRNIFKQIIINTQKQKEGEIKITAYQPNQILKGEQIFAFLTFQILKEYPASIKIKFLGADVVTDSNLVSQTTQKDILSEVEGLNLNL
jgi:hypothetical protein